MLRIAYLDHTGELGGAEHVLLLLLSGFAQSQVTPILICAEEGPFPEKARRLAIKTEIVNLPTFISLSVVVGRLKILNPVAVIRNAFALLRSALRVRPILQMHEVRIVQTNSAFAHIYGGLAARLIGIPCVWYFHDFVERDRLMGLTALVWRILAYFLATNVIAVSKAVEKSIGAGTRCSAIYVGQPDAPKETPFERVRSSLGLDEQAILVGYVGRIAYVKGLDNLVMAAEKITALDSRVHFVVMGESLFGESGVKAALAEMVELRGINHRWHWLGYDHDAFSKIRDFDFLVLPSRREALGVVLLEAGMAAKAVVATWVGGIPEIVVNGETGILVPPDNPDELARAMLRLVDSPEQAIEMGRKARERITSLFSLPRYYKEFDRLYRSLAGQEK